LPRPAFLAVALLLSAGPASAASDPEMAKRVAACAPCHGEAGRSSKDEKFFPSIAGKPSGYLQQQMLNFRDGRRQHAIMQRMFAYLSDDYLLAIAQYYAEQTPKIAQPVAGASAETLDVGRELVQSGDRNRDVPACSACHGESLTGAQPSIPGLAALPADYLAAQLGAWRNGTRKARDPDCMAQIARKLSDAEIKSVTAWIASRPVESNFHPAAQAPANLPLSCGGVQQ